MISNEMRSAVRLRAEGYSWLEVRAAVGEDDEVRAMMEHRRLDRLFAAKVRRAARKLLTDDRDADDARKVLNA
jgi:hypothetical protein